jgi:hypothetical protein
VTDERRPQPGTSGSGDVPVSEPDPSLEALRDILFRHYRERIDELETELDGLEQRVTDRDALVATISPVMGDAIRRQIRDAREEMIEALYPIIGQLVMRAVSEAVRDLAHRVDTQVRRSFDPRALSWRLRARLGGASPSEMSLRARLPFEVQEVFLIHRESGLLLWHASRDPAVGKDSDLVGSMLTAIRDFAEDAFGRGREGELDNIDYGDQRILIEPARHSYLAVVVDGVEPPGFRAEIQRRLFEVERAHADTLGAYDGDASALALAEASLQPLMSEGTEPAGLTRTHWAMVAGAVSLLAICLVVACLAGRWALAPLLSTPTPVPVAIEWTATQVPTPTHTPTWTPTWTPTATPSATPTPTSTPTATPSATPTSTYTPSPVPTSTPTPAPVIGLMTGNAWLRQEPSAGSPRLGMVAERGQQVELLAIYDDWCQIRWAPFPQGQAVGWVPLRWVGTLDPIPASIVTATAAP